jgi:hypothetical protein
MAGLVLPNTIFGVPSSTSFAQPAPPQPAAPSPSSAAVALTAPVQESQAADTSKAVVNSYSSESAAAIITNVSGIVPTLQYAALLQGHGSG